MIATDATDRLDGSKDQNEKFDSVRLVSEVFYLSSSSAIVTCLEVKSLRSPSRDRRYSLLFEKFSETLPGSSITRVTQEQSDSSAV